MFNSYCKENINDQLYYNDYVKSFDHFPYPSTLEPRLKATDCGGSPNIFIRGGSAPRSSPPYPFSAEPPHAGSVSSRAPWVIKFGKLSSRENLVMTSPYVRHPSTKWLALGMNRLC